jgi:NADH-quinone oxidoreductase subunit G
LRTGPARSPSLDEIEHSDAVFVLGEDVTNVAPIMALRLRQSVRQAPMRMADQLGIPRWLDQSVREVVQDTKGSLFIASPYATKLDNVATSSYRATPDNLARLGFAVAHAIDPEAPDVIGLPEELTQLADQIASALVGATTPLVVSGASCRSQSVIEAAAQVAWALCKMGHPALLSFTTPECNSFGFAMMEARPLSAAFETVTHEPATSVVVLENDLTRRAPERDVLSLLQGARHLVVLDHIESAMTETAEVVFPAGTFAESEGTLVNNEGRAQRFFQVFAPSTDVEESWRWLREASIAAGSEIEPDWHNFDDLTTTMAAEIPAFASIPLIAPTRKALGKIAREPNRYSGRTSMLANISVHEPKPPDDPDSALAFSMESGPESAPPALIPFFWAPGWNSIQAVNKFQIEVGGPLRGGDPRVRLIEPSAQPDWSYFSEIPIAYGAGQSEWLIIPIFHIFGSEELSRYAHGLSQLVPAAYIALHPSDASRLGATAGDEIRVNIRDSSFELPLILRDDLPRGTAGLPAGLVSIGGMRSPLLAQLAPAKVESPAEGAA